MLQKVLHTFDYPENFKAKEYKENIDDFWKNLRKDWNIKYDFNKNEKLCSICLTKRVVGSILSKDSKHILNKTFKNNDNFPSTTEIALDSYFKRKKITDKKKKREIAQELHDNKSDSYKKVKDNEKYYAILMMDGDKMGELVNGKNLYSTWNSIMHPEIKRNIQSFDDFYKNSWNKILNNSKRLLTPSIHAAISESLGDFALYGVKSIIKKYDGKLIYAGGDDVAAILPTSTVLKAAKEIEEYYKSEYKFIESKSDNGVNILTHNMNSSEATNDYFDLRETKAGKLSIGLGKGEKLSISAGVLICHHKENLSQMIARSHNVLDKAKDSGRDACAIELKKRSGGSRYFVKSFKDEKVWDSFNKLVETLGGLSSDISRSFIYKLNLFKDGIDAILKNENHKELLLKFLAKELKNSGLKLKDKEKLRYYTQRVYDLTVSENDNKKIFSNEGLIITSFLAKGEDNG